MITEILLIILGVWGSIIWIGTILLRLEDEKRQTIFMIKEIIEMNEREED